jgi:subtilisin family serine protease
MVADHRAGQGIRVLVIDTGLDQAAAGAPWLAGVTGDPDPGVGGGVINRYAGHGTFIAGVIRTVAPAAEVIVRAGLPAVLFKTGQPATNPPGTAFERDLVSVLERYLVQDNPDVISLSAGTYSDLPGGPMLLNAFNDLVLHRHKGVVLVAAAGNDAGRARFWPAAGRGAVGVGALASHWRSRASFSNFGAWVDVYAPGEHLINAFPSGVYTYTEPPRRGVQQQFEGMATWSGTSFSTPMVAGLIAARMSRTGENGPDAAAALIAQARRDAIPGLGAILLPSGEAGAGRRPEPAPCRHDTCSSCHC